MKRTVRRILTIAPLAAVGFWLAPLAAHAGNVQNHNETLVHG